MLGHGFDHVQDAADLVAFALQMAHGFGGVADFGGQALDLRDGFVDYLVTFAGLLIGGDGGFGGFFGVARNFLHGGGHFVHGGCDLIGFDLLTVDPGAGLLGDGRQLFSGAGDLRDAIADAADQFAQTLGHALHGPLQLAEFVAALRRQVVGQVTTGDALGHDQGLVQWNDDLSGDRPGGQQAEGDGQHGGEGQHVLGMGGVGVTHDGLRDGEFLAHVQQDVALGGHACQGLGAGHLGVAELADGGAVGLQ
ncbi:hypothetical protein D3C78_924200 [compost metagenome]